VLWAAKVATIWQDSARSGKVGGKNGKVLAVCGHMHAIMLAAAHAMSWLCLPLHGDVQARVTAGGAGN